MIKVRFQPSGLFVLAQPGQSLFELARAAGVPVSTACVGKGTCGLCRVRVRHGEDLLTPLTDADRKHLGNVYFLTKTRLSCQARLVAPDARPVAPGEAAVPPSAWVEVEVPASPGSRPGVPPDRRPR
jgi:ferredoxin